MGTWSNLSASRVSICTSCLVLATFFLCALLFSASDDLSIPLFSTRASVFPDEDSPETFTRADKEKLKRSLGRVSFRNSTVLLTTLNKSWAANDSMLDMFLASFQLGGDQTKELLDHLLIVNLDQASYDRCVQVHRHCYKLMTEDVDFTGEKIFMSSDYLKMMWRRVDFLRLVLELGYNFVFTDADILWFRDPFQHFSPDVDFEIACDRFNGNERDLNNYPNGGFVHAVSNNRTLAFYKMWYKARLGYPKHHDQDVFNDIKHTNAFRRTELKVRFLDTSYFGGFCQPSRDLDKVCTMHANCCTTLERKVFDLRLVLEDWKRYKSLTDEERRERRVFWRAPRECLKSFH